MLAKMSKDNSPKEKEIIPRSFLQSGNNLQITNTITFKHPTIQDIIDIDKDHFGLNSENLYYSMVNVFLTDPYTYMVYLDDKGIDYETVSSFDVFCLLFNDYTAKIVSVNETNSGIPLTELLKNSVYFKAFNFFLGIESFYITKDQSGNDVLAYDNNQYLMNSTMYDVIAEFIKKINGIPDEEKIYPEDEWAKQILIEDEREKIKRQAKKPKEDTNNNRLGNLLSAITWSCNGGITPFNRNQLHMYDLVDGIHRTDKLLNYRNTMVGLYSGCVDKKKIDFNELHWST